jgi:hypothetical protein
MTPEAPHSEISPAKINSEIGRAPATRNCCTTSPSEPGGTSCESACSIVFETKGTPLCTRIVAVEVSTGKKESSPE